MSGRHVIELLAGDGRTREAKLWIHWLRHVPSIRRQFLRWSEDFDPFRFNEAASVAVLANAAAKAGYLAHTEYVAVKRHSTRGRPFRNGRCDLWIADATSGTSWAFEAKQHFAATRIRQSTFEQRLERARLDARSVHSDEADRRVGCLIMVPGQYLIETEAIIDHFDRLCRDTHLAFRIGRDKAAIWIVFSFVN